MRGGREFRCAKTAARIPVVADIDRLIRNPTPKKRPGQAINSRSHNEPFQTVLLSNSLLEERRESLR
jgi:hypothetical protein